MTYEERSFLLDVMRSARFDEKTRTEAREILEDEVHRLKSQTEHRSARHNFLGAFRRAFSSSTAERTLDSSLC